MAEVQHTSKYTTAVDELSEAWTFIMAHIDGLDEPSIWIGPEYLHVHAFDDDGNEVIQSIRKFGVMVEGIVVE